jgi:hypothetical protein
MTYVFENALGALRGLRYQNETMVMPKQGENYMRLYHDTKSNTLNVLGHRNTLQCFEFPQAHNVHPRIAFELSCLDVAEQLGYKLTADVLRPVLMDMLLGADFSRFKNIREEELEVVAPRNNAVHYLLTTANTYLKG